MQSINLFELRRREKVSQAEMAKRTGVTQATICITEKQEDILISTLRRMIDAMDGELAIVVRTRSGVYELTQFDPKAASKLS